MTKVCPPKYLCWPKSQSIGQAYCCDFDLLITGGCSFTSSTLWFDGPASWPGYVRDRCGIKKAIDMSYPGAGNLFISDSVKFALTNLCNDHSHSSILVIIMWSGIDRQEITRLATVNEINDNSHPIIDNKIYHRKDAVTKEMRKESTLTSRNLILGMATWMNSKKIKWIFTSYVNLLYPPFIPKRDTTHHWPEFLDETKLENLHNLPWIPKNPMDYLYEWAWVNDYLNQGDHFHPPNEANFAWVDQVFLPEIEKLGLISKL